MKNTIIQIIKISIFLGIGVFLIWYAFKDLKQEDIIEIKKTISTVNYFWVALSIIPAILSHYIRALRWNILLEASGKKAKIFNTTIAVIVGYFANIIIPRMGEISRCTVLKKTDNIDVETSIGTVIIERIIDTLVLLVLIVLLFLLEGDVLINAFGDKFTGYLQKINYPWYVFASIGLIGVIGFWYVFYKLDLNKIGEKIPFLGKIIKLFEGFKKGFLSVFKLKNPFLFILYSFSIWALYGICIIVFFKALPETSSLGLMPAFSLLILGSFAYIIVQGGIGAYQLVAMQTLAIYGISNNAGLAFGWVNWTIQTAFIIILGLICSLYVLSLKTKIDEVQN